MSEKLPKAPVEVIENPNEAIGDSDSTEDIGNLGLGQHVLQRFSGIKLLSNYNDHLLADFQPKFHQTDERLQSQLQLAAELMHSAYQPELSNQPTGDLGSDRLLWRNATNLAIENAQKAQITEEVEQTKSYLLAGLMIDYSCQGNSQNFAKQAVSSGLTTELLATVEDNQDLVLRGERTVEGIDMETIISKVLGQGSTKNMIEVATGRKLVVSKLDMHVAQELTETEIDQHIGKLCYDELSHLGVSTEVSQRNPKLQAEIIKTAVSRLHDPYGFYPSPKDSLVSLADLAQVRPDIMSSHELDGDFQQIRQRRAVGSNHRYGDQGVVFLDDMIIKTWQAGCHELASKMLTPSKAEVTNGLYAYDEEMPNRHRGDLGWAASYGDDIDNARLSVTLDEISEHVNQRREAMFTQANQFIDSFSANLQLNQDDDQLTYALKDVLQESRIDESPDPEHYVQLVTNMMPMLVDKLDIADVHRITDNLRGYRGYNDGNHRLEVAKVMQDERMVNALSAYPGDMLGFLMDRPKEFKQVVDIISNQHFEDIINRLQISEAVHDQAINSLRRAVSQGQPDSVTPDVYLAAFSDETGLTDVLAETPENLRSQFFLQAIEKPHKAAHYAALLANDETVELLTRGQEHEWFDGPVIDYLTDNYGSSEQLASKAQELFSSLKTVSDRFTDDSPLGGHMMTKIIQAPAGEYHRTMNQLMSAVSRPRDLWKSLYIFSTDMMGIDPGQDNANVHPIATLPKIELNWQQPDPSSHFIDNVDGFRLSQVADMEPEHIRSLLKDPQSFSDQRLNHLTTIPFNEFQPDVKRQIYAYMLYETIQATRSAEAKAEADQRNRRQIQAGQSLEINQGDFIHSTSTDSLNSLLQDGNIAGESRKLSSKRDAFPFNVDLSVVKEPKQTPAETIGQTLSGSYGDMSLIYAHERASWVSQHALAIDRHEERLHSLVLGGIPSTEISAIVVNKPTDVQLTAHSRAIAENGFYIPLYSGQGELLLSAEQYDDLRASYNIEATKIDTVLDNSLSTNRRLGSNDGSEYYIPTNDQDLQRYYIKFGGHRCYDNQDVSGIDHVWTEFLADEMYRHFGVAVPATKMVQVEGRVGKASEWLDEQTQAEAEITSRSGGFVMDAWLGNWDIVHNPNNIIEEHGVSYRIDNGNALDIRAQGDRKPADLWTETVGELEASSDINQLGHGMRSHYPNLTSQAFAEQVDRLIAKFPDEKIDEMVDSIRRRSDDRDNLKQTLKDRRDYIVAHKDRITNELSSTSADTRTFAMAA